MDAVAVIRPSLYGVPRHSGKDQGRGLGQHSKLRFPERLPRDYVWANFSRGATVRRAATRFNSRLRYMNRYANDGPLTTSPKCLATPPGIETLMTSLIFQIRTLRPLRTPSSHLVSFPFLTTSLIRPLQHLTSHLSPPIQHHCYCIKRCIASPRTRRGSTGTR
jgi:hypothetical protein